MTRLTELLRKPFDALYAVTSNETAERGVYADTRSEGDHFSITSTQSGVSTYAAYDGDTDGDMPESVLPRASDAYDCSNPRTCPTCHPAEADD